MPAGSSKKPFGAGALLLFYYLAKKAANNSDVSYSDIGATDIAGFFSLRDRSAATLAYSMPHGGLTT